MSLFKKVSVLFLFLFLLIPTLLAWADQVPVWIRRADNTGEPNVQVQLTNLWTGQTEVQVTNAFGLLIFDVELSDGYVYVVYPLARGIPVTPDYRTFYHDHTWGDHPVKVFSVE